MESRTKRRSAAEWASLVEEQASSGQTIGNFCQNQGLVQATFMYWRKKLGLGANSAKKHRPPPVSGFVAMLPRNNIVGSIVLRGRCGVEVEVPPGTPPDTLQALIVALSC
jgi:hypothetical protein